MKKSLVLASLLMLSSTVLVADSAKEWFVGGEFGGMRVNAKATAEIPSYGSMEEETSDNTTYEAIKFGKYFDNARLYGFYAHQNKKDITTADSIGIGYDYMFKNFDKVTPFIGAQLMYIQAKIDDVEQIEFDTLKGVGYGIGAGILYSVTDSVEIETGLRYVKSNMDASTTYMGASMEIEMEDYTQYYLGVNYKF